MTDEEEELGFAEEEELGFAEEEGSADEDLTELVDWSCEEEAGLEEVEAEEGLLELSEAED